MIYKGKNKVGRIEAESRTERELIIDNFEKLNGTAKLKKVGEKPPVWEDTPKQEIKKYQMKVTIKDGSTPGPDTDYCNRKGVLCLSSEWRNTVLQSVAAMQSSRRPIAVAFSSFEARKALVSLGQDLNCFRSC